MNTKLYFKSVAIALFAAVTAMSCVDKKFVIDNIDDIDPSVGIAPNGLNIPLVTIERTLLKDMIGEVEGLVANQAGGGYAYRYAGTIDPQTMDAFGLDVIDLGSTINAGLSTIDITGTIGDTNINSIDFPGAQLNFELDFPDFDFAGATAAEEIAPGNTAGKWPEGLDRLKGQSLTQALIDLMPGGGVISGSQLSSANITKNLLVVDVDIPEEISRINTVWLSDKANSAEGCLITMSVDLGSLQSVNDGAVIDKLEVTLPKRYTLVEHSSHPAALTSSAGNGNNNVLTATNIDMGVNRTFDFQFYVSEVDLDDLTPVPSSEPGMTTISTENVGNQDDEKIGYKIDYSMTLKPGTIPFSPVAPSVKILGQPVFKDAEFTTNTISKSFQAEVSFEDFVFEDIPGSVKRINKVAFSSATVNLTLNNLGLPFADTPIVDITFPNNFKFAASHTEPYFTSETNTFHLSTAQLSDAGYPITIDYIIIEDPENEMQGVPDSEGKLDLSSFDSIKVSINHSFAPATFLYSADIAPLNSIGGPSVDIDPATFNVNMSESVFSISGAGELSYPVHFETSINQSLSGILEQVKSIDWVEFVSADDSGEKVLLTLSIDIAEPLINQFKLDNVRIAFPDFVKLKQVKPYITGHVYSNNDGIIINALQSPVDIMTFTIEGLENIEVNQPAGTALLAGNLSVDLRVSAVDESVTVGWGTMQITPRITIPTAKVSKVAGSFEISVDDYIAPEDRIIDLSEVYDFFDNGSIAIPGLAPPIVKLDFVNPTGITMNNTLLLTPKDKEGKAILPGTGAVEVPFSFKEGENHLYITQGGVSKAPAGYTGFDANLAPLFSAIPYSLEVGLVGGQSGPGSYIELSDTPYLFEMSYEIEVPLSFDGDMNLPFEHEIGGLNDVFSNLDVKGLKVSQVSLVAEIETSIPLMAENARVLLLDSNGDLAGVDTSIDKVFEGPAPSISSKTSTLMISLIIPDDGDLHALSKVDKVKLFLPLQSTAQSGRYGAIGENDFIQGRVYLSIPQGASYELDLH